MPLSGKVTEKNDDVEETPERINEDAYQAWLVKLELKDASQVESLMNAEKYKEFCESN
jgi:glycine cleavage system H protein